MMFIIYPSNNIYINDKHLMFYGHRCIVTSIDVRISVGISCALNCSIATIYLVAWWEQYITYYILYIDDKIYFLHTFWGRNEILDVVNKAIDKAST